MSAPSVHLQKVPAGSRSYDRGRVRGQNDQHRGKTDQAANLGHSESQVLKRH